MAKKKQIKEQDIPTSINVSVYWYKDEDTGKIVFDFEEMANDFENKLSELDPSAVVMCSIEND